jgi:hypothetical protein
MSLEGRLRELGLAEVLQLLSLSRKTGTLQLRAMLDAREATIVVEDGWIVDATEEGMFETTKQAVDERSVSERVLAMLRWTDGEFRFVTDLAPIRAGRVRISTEQLLMEGARRADAWAGLHPSVPGPHVIAAFPDVQPQQLSLLHLTPDQWEILTRVDGRRSIAELASSLQHDVIDVATTVHGMIEAGVLMVSSGPAPKSTAIPTPLPSPAVPNRRSGTASAESEPQRQAEPDPVWPAIPPVYSPELPFVLPYESSDDDTLFDPMQVGVMTPDGMPTMSERAAAPVSRAEQRVTRHKGTPVSAARAVETSGERRARAEALLRAGDRAAAGGDLLVACRFWQQCLDVAAAPSDATTKAVQERVALARRLHALLHS